MRSKPRLYMRMETSYAASSTAAVTSFSATCASSPCAIFSPGRERANYGASSCRRLIRTAAPSGGDARRAKGVLVARDFPPFEKTHCRLSFGTIEEMKTAVAVFDHVLSRKSTPFAERIDS